MPLDRALSFRERFFFFRKVFFDVFFYLLIK